MSDNLQLNNRLSPPNAVHDDFNTSILDHLDGAMDYRLTNDYLFKSVFQKDNEALCSLIAALLHKKRDEIISVEIKNPIILGEVIDNKTCIMDLKVLLNNQIYINIEMQVTNRGNWEERSVYLLMREAPKLISGSDYKALSPFHQIGILDYNFPQQNDQFHREILLMDKATHKLYSDKLSIHVLCLPMIEKATQEDHSSGLYFWAKVFRATTWKSANKKSSRN